jgi:hypothetical protein
MITHKLKVVPITKYLEIGNYRVDTVFEIKPTRKISATDNSVENFQLHSHNHFHQTKSALKHDIMLFFSAHMERESKRYC